MTLINFIAWFMLPAFLSAILSVTLIKPAKGYNLVDHPAGRKKHTVSTPLVGGIAIFLSLVISHLWVGQVSMVSNSLLIALLVTVTIGVADDAHEIGHRSKFFAQLIAALVIVSGTDVHVRHFGDILAVGDLALNKWAYLVTVVAIIGLMNAFNMIDGLDGLAGTQAMAPALALMVVAYMAGNMAIASELMMLAGAIAGFLCFNLRTPWRKHARVFMGDTGGLLLGLLLAWYSINLAGNVAAPLKPITAVWILAVPLLDMGAVMFLRMRQKKSPFSADRQHLHYVLVDAGFSVSQAVWAMAFASLVFAILALFAQKHGVPELAMFVGFIVLLVAYMALLKHPIWIAERADHSATPR